MLEDIVSAPPQPQEILWWSDIIINSVFSHLKGNKLSKLSYLLQVNYLANLGGWNSMQHTYHLLPFKPKSQRYANTYNHTQIPAHTGYRISSCPPPFHLQGRSIVTFSSLVPNSRKLNSSSLLMKETSKYFQWGAIFYISESLKALHACVWEERIGFLRVMSMNHTWINYLYESISLEICGETQENN